MGYNPYMCIVCRCVEDNGWGNYYSVGDICDRLNLNINLNESTHDGLYIITHDVCNRCINKQGKNPIFNNFKGKKDRTIHWFNEYVNAAGYRGRWGDNSPKFNNCFKKWKIATHGMIRKNIFEILNSSIKNCDFSSTEFMSNDEKRIWFIKEFGFYFINYQE